jgi:hypothetical protein
VRRGIAASTQAGASYLIADRWLATGSVAHERAIRQRTTSFGKVRSSNWGLLLRVDLDYYLEDHLSLRLSAASRQLAEATDGVPGAAARRAYLRNDNFSLGLSYRFIGAARAPGVIEPMGRLAPQPIVE